MSVLKHSQIIFIDGYCVLCNRLADFILKKDTNETIKLATLQGVTFKKVRSQIHEPIVDSVIFMDGEVFYQKSDAILNIMRLLPYPYKLLTIFRLIPRWLRDYFYDLTAKKRANLFGRRDSCRLPSSNEAGRILE
jgi:predicted DCC family thiol-disulfide oxidoreductase YuxK